MSAKRIIRIIIGILLLAVLVVYGYMAFSAAPKSSAVIGSLNAKPAAAEDDYSEPEQLAVPGNEQDVEPVEPEQPSEAPETEEPADNAPAVDPESPAGRAAALGLPVPPDVDVTSWEFIFANATHSIGSYGPNLVTVANASSSVELDERIADAMRSFVAGAEAEGLSVYLSSGYRSYDEQTYLFNAKINSGYSREDAARIVAPPGTSEHQTGLCCDITYKYVNPKYWADLEPTDLYQWMSQHCQEYGFIVRYPKDKSGLDTAAAAESVTGIIYEPWHFRYVGVEAATYIMANNLCLEEFLALYGVE